MPGSSAVRKLTALLFEATLQDLELNNILKAHGCKAMERRAREDRRNAERQLQRKLFRANTSITPPLPKQRSSSALPRNS